MVQRANGIFITYITGAAAITPSVYGIENEELDLYGQHTQETFLFSKAFLQVLEPTHLFVQLINPVFPPM